MTSFNLRNRHFLLLDILFSLCTPAAAFALRIGTTDWLWNEYRVGLFLFTLASVVVKLPVFYAMGFYRRYWRYASVDELRLIGVTVVQLTIGLTIASWAIQNVSVMPGLGLPRSVPILDGMLTLLAVGGIRFSVRAMGSAHQPNRNGAADKKRVLIVGAGDAGAMIVRELRSSPLVNLEPVGFVDDSPDKQGVYIHGVLVLGKRQDIPKLVQAYHIGEVIVAMPTAPGKTIREIVSLCEAARVPSRTVPGMYEILAGRVSVNQLRHVDIEDLLRREPVKTDSTEVVRMLSGARVLVTGAGGSIGSELCRQILRAGPSRLTLLGHGENSLFLLNQELRRLFPHAALDLVVADIRDAARLTSVFQRIRPQIIFHAAAHKHVPLMECNIEEAITNNVLGTRNVAELAEKFQVEQLVAISSDKAVNPTNVMGVTKRIAELLVQEAGVYAGRPFVSVRFGNVLGSRGSVVPFFRQQIAAGGPITVTHPDVTRYFMTIPEAVQLVLQAGAMGQPGNVFVLDMGEPIKIVELARDLIRLSGLEEGRDIDIVFTGLRPGEKLSEELFNPGEDYQRTAHEKIFVIHNGQSAKSSVAPLPDAINELIVAAQASHPNLQAMLKRIVPEYHPLEAEPERPYYISPSKVAIPPTKQAGAYAARPPHDDYKLAAD